MTALTLALFTQAQQDYEAAQYRILARLQQARQALHHNKLYPVMSELVELTSVLQTIETNKAQYRNVMPKDLRGVDFEKRTLVFENQPANEEGIEAMFSLISWALPQLVELANESMEMFEFVMNQLELHVVGIMPIYKDEGYAIIADPASSVYHILRYELSLFMAHDEQYRAMKTIEVQTRTQDSLLNAPENIKLDLVHRYRDLPNPATYLLDVALDLPFAETILPVAKRKLMRQLVS
jgi:hypothetical protein